MSKLKKTFYTNSKGITIPAYVGLENATPSDTTVRVIPKVYGGTEHIVTWPAQESSTQPLVQYYRDNGDLELVTDDDPDNIQYWLRTSKEALHNADNSTWRDKLKAFIDRLTKKANGGNIQRQQYLPE